MNELKSYTEYAVSTPTADFVIGFDFNYGEDAVNVTVDNVPATTAGYTVVYLNETTIRLSPSVPSGVVRLQRETDIDQTDHAYRAGAKFIAQTMDENFEQLRHSQQEVRDGFSKLSEDTHEIIEGLDAALELAQDAAQDAQDAAVIAQGAADTVNAIIVGGKVSANNVLDASAETQQQVNYNGGSKWHSRTGGYKLNERVVLANGDIVKSTIDGNTNDPNVDMTGWSFDENTVESVADLITIKNPKLGQTILAKSINSAIKHGGGFFEYNGSEWDLIPLTQLRLSSFGDTSNTVNAFTRLFAYIQALPTTLSENGQPIRKITIDLEGLTWNLTTSVFGVQGIGGLRFTNGTIRADDGFLGDYLCEFTDTEALRAYHFITFDNIIFDANYKTSCFRINRALKCGFSTCHFLRWKTNGYGLVVGKTPTDTLGADQEAHEVFVNGQSTFSQYDFSTVWGGQVCSGTALYINTYDGHYSDFVISYTGRGIEHIRTGLNIFDNIHIYGVEEKDYGFFIDCTSSNPFVNLVNIYMDECSIRVLNPNQIAITNSKIFRNDQSTRGLIIFDTSQQYVDASRIVMTGNHFNTSTALGKKQVEFVTESGGVWGGSAGYLIKSHSNTYLGYVEPIETGSDIQDVYKYNGYNLTKRYPLDETGTFTFDLKTVHNKQNGQNVSASCSEWLITSNWQATSGNGVGVFRLVVFLMSSGQYACTIEAEGVGFTSGVKNLPIGFKSVPVLSSAGVLTVVLDDFYRGSIFRCDTRQTKVIN